MKIFIENNEGYEVFLLFVCRVQPESFSWFSSGATGSDVGKANCISSAGGNQTFGPYYCTLSS